MSSILSDKEVELICQVLCHDDSTHQREGATSSNSKIESCIGCDLPLNWSAPRVGFWATPNQCPSCGHCIYVASDDAKTLPAGKSVVHSPDTESPVDEQLRKYIDSQIPSASNTLSPGFENGGEINERRQTARYPFAARILAVPLDENWRVIGQTIEMLANDISHGGMKLITSSTLEAPALLLHIASRKLKNLQLLAQIRWKATRDGLTEIGCQFARAGY